MARAIAPQRGLKLNKHGTHAMGKMTDQEKGRPYMEEGIRTKHLL